MNYLDFSGALARWPQFVEGGIYTTALSSMAMALGLAIGIVGAAMRRSRVRPLRVVSAAYVELIRNTPFLVQIYIIYFGMPSVGIRISALTAALISLSVYSGAYITEIVRAGIDSIDKGQIEAARTLGLSPYLTFRHVVLKPAIAAIYPSLTSQFILIMLASSIVSAISVPELTGAANDIQGFTFRSLEAFLIVAGLYIALTAIFHGVFALAGRSAFAFRHAGR
ncbi:amino acid ABC transporter permease [Bosea sp. 2YAB26]|uniref:amino acid ABC transporter permease n=1 Tax=Bosea sp. 2YAB26 TaxID=3237478 RepID=UPI003F8FEAA1